MHRWVHPEFEDEEGTSIEVEAGTGTEEDVVVNMVEEDMVVNMEEDKDMVNNCTTSRHEEKIVVDVESSRF